MTDGKGAPTTAVSQAVTSARTYVTQTLTEEKEKKLRIRLNLERTEPW